VALKILIPFNTVSLHGMERGVIETFDLLRPEIDPHFLLSCTTRRLNLPVLEELQGRGLSFSFFSDTEGWPRIAKPRSLSEAWKMVKATLIGNRDVLRAAQGKDVIYLPGANYFVFATAAAIKHRLQNRQRRIIYQFHDLVLKRSRLLGMVSPFVTDFVHNTETGRRAVTVPNPYVAKKRNWIVPLPVQARLRAQENTFDITGAGNILFVGQIAKHKGIDLLLDAHKLLRQSHPNAVLHIVGEFQEEESAAMIREAISKDTGIKYWGYRDDVLNMMRRADIYVHPSPPSRFSESFGRGVVEAMSTGTPVVCFRSGALEEIVGHEQTGLICAEETAEELARNLRRLLDDSDLRERCSKSARAEFEKKYSNSTVKARWMKLFELS
jgi:glycosyltransferase involved in cell wall biosynthesis